MADHKNLDATQPLERPAKIKVDDRGRAVWSGAVGTGKFELVSTEVLQSILDSGDREISKVIDDLGGDPDEGLLARNNETGCYEMVKPDLLESLAVQKPGGDGGFGFAAEEQKEPDPEASDELELELVSTQVLKQMLAGEDPDSPALDLEEGESTGFDPYNSSS